MTAGFSPQDFWGLTIRLYQIHMQGARARMQREADEGKALAWLTAKLSRADKIPGLDRILRQDGEVVDLQFRLGKMKAGLPTITMAEWRNRQR